MKNLNEMEPISPFEKEGIICQTCGDKGFTNAYVYCVKCLQFVIHRYCLYVMPKTFTEPVIWYCETCKPTVQNQVTSPQLKSSPSQNTDEAKKNINPIWSETSSSDSDSDSDSTSSSSNWNEFDKWEERIALQNQRIDRIIEDMIISNPNLILEDYPSGTQKRSCDSEICNPTHSDNHKKKRKKESDIESQMPNFENNGENMENCYVHAQPIIYPVWRGSFSVCDDLFEGFLGHLSNKACGKVSEEANMMPSLLQLQMHPKTLLWPKSFKDTEPLDDHIALYFFPGDSINERAFDGLVQDMMDGDLAMRATVKNADLLIFTSAALPLMFRRFQGKYYLWGVFNGHQS